MAAYSHSNISSVSKSSRISPHFERRAQSELSRVILSVLKSERSYVSQVVSSQTLTLKISNSRMVASSSHFRLGVDTFSSKTAKLEFKQCLSQVCRNPALDRDDEFESCQSFRIVSCTRAHYLRNNLDVSPWPKFRMRLIDKWRLYL